jgi:hypothetical protein
MIGVEITAIIYISCTLRVVLVYISAALRNKRHQQVLSNTYLSCPTAGEQTMPAAAAMGRGIDRGHDAGRVWRARERLSLAREGAVEAENRDTKSRPRAEIYAGRDGGNIPTRFKESLERCFCVFAKIIRIPSGFEELLEML